jgi:hypothetical protein
VASLEKRSADAAYITAVRIVPMLGAPPDITAPVTIKISERIAAERVAVYFPSLFLVTKNPVTAPDRASAIIEKSPTLFVGSSLKYSITENTRTKAKYEIKAVITPMKTEPAPENLLLFIRLFIKKASK